MVLPLALTVLQNLIVAFFILVCVALILIILLQKGKGGGLGAAFGGGGAGSLLGTKTGDFLTWVTISLVAGFLVLAVLMGKFMRPTGSSSLSAPVAPPATPVTAPITGAESIVVEDAEAGTPEAADETVVPEVDVVPEQADGTEADAETTE